MSKNSHSHPPSEAALHSLLRFMGLLRQVMDPFFSRFGISGPQWGILRVLHRAETQGEKALRLTDVSQRMLIQPPSVTGVVGRMERLGLVARKDSTDDLRVRRVGLTPGGRKLIGRVQAKHREQINAVFAGLKPDELDRLVELLEKLDAHMATLAPRSPSRTARRAGT